LGLERSGMKKVTCGIPRLFPLKAPENFNGLVILLFDAASDAGTNQRI
jgi:hypothetical protein